MLFNLIIKYQATASVIKDFFFYYSVFCGRIAKLINQLLFAFTFPSLDTIVGYGQGTHE